MKYFIPKGTPITVYCVKSYASSGGSPLVSFEILSSYDYYTTEVSPILNPKTHDVLLGIAAVVFDFKNRPTFNGLPVSYFSVKEAYLVSV